MSKSNATDYARSSDVKVDRSRECVGSKSMGNERACIRAMHSYVSDLTENLRSKLKIERNVHVMKLKTERHVVRLEFIKGMWR